MALIDCPECGREISSRAPACIHCGCPLDFFAPEAPADAIPVSVPPQTPHNRRSPSPPTSTFRSLSRGLSNTTVGFFWATAGIYLLGSALLFTVVGWWEGLYPFSELDVSTVATIDDAASISMAFAWPVYMATGVLFVIWFFQAYKSAESLGATERKWGAGWTIGSWFIPAAQFVIPKLVLNEVDRMSNPAAGEPPIGDRWRRLPRLESSDWWWGLFLMGLFTLAASRRLASSSEYQISYEQLSLIDAFGALFFGIAAILAAYTVRSLGSRLCQLDDELRRRSAVRVGMSSSRRDPFLGRDWIRGHEWFGSDDTLVRCLSCNKDVYFPAELSRHEAHRIAPHSTTAAVPPPQGASSDEIPTSNPADIRAIGERHRSLTPNDPIGAAGRAHDERLAYAEQLHAEGRYTDQQLESFRKASEAELARDKAEANRSDWSDLP